MRSSYQITLTYSFRQAELKVQMFPVNCSRGSLFSTERMDFVTSHGLYVINTSFVEAQTRQSKLLQSVQRAHFLTPYSATVGVFLSLTLTRTQIGHSEPDAL